MPSFKKPPEHLLKALANLNPCAMIYQAGGRAASTMNTAWSTASKTACSKSHSAGIIIESGNPLIRETIECTVTEFPRIPIECTVTEFPEFLSPNSYGVQSSPVQSSPVHSIKLNALSPNSYRHQIATPQKKRGWTLAGL